MSSRVGKVRVVAKGGKVKIEARKGYATKRRHLKAARLAKAWESKRCGTS